MLGTADRLLGLAGDGVLPPTSVTPAQLSLGPFTTPALPQPLAVSAGSDATNIAQMLVCQVMLPRLR